jgi:secreted trypsin-like serine protease
MINNLIILAATILALRANETTNYDDEILVRIINGREARPFSFPFIASLQLNGTHFCGGSLLDNSTIITAAHCTETGYSIKDITASIRRHDLRKSSKEEGGQTIKIKRAISHPKFGGILMYNDIAVWKLASPVSVPVSFVTLDDGKYASQVDLPAETIGWGRINPNNGDTAPRLQHTILPIYNNDECSKSYYDAISKEEQVCAGYSEAITTSCQGDSGGPLFIKEDDRFILIGITSFGKTIKCLSAGFPTVSLIKIIKKLVFSNNI